MTQRGWWIGLIVVALAACGEKEAPAGPTPGDPATAPPASATPDAPPAANEEEPEPKADPVPRVEALEVKDLGALRADARAAEAKLTVIAVWATWCAPCVEEMPILEAFYQRHRAAGVRVVGLSTDDRDELGERIQAVFERTKVTYPQALLPPGGEDAFFTAIGKEWDGQLPKTVVLDASGEVVAYFATAVTAELLDTQVAPLLSP